MSIRTYNFDFDYESASVSFRVDASKFTKEMARENLEFFLWDYDHDADPLLEIMKKYAMEAIRVSTFKSCNKYGVIKEFEDMEGFVKLDGSSGITILDVSSYEFEDELLECKIT